MTFYTIAWRGDHVSLIDQTRLPAEEVYVRCDTADDVARAIRDMLIRGAPAIGIAAAMGVALGAAQAPTADEAELRAATEHLRAQFALTRPTAVNLFWALERMREAETAVAGQGAAALRAALVRTAEAMLADDIAINRAMGRHGAELLPSQCTVLTHCNAGALATGGYGTALGVVRAAREAGKKVRVIADETRPYLQGARLTAWELVRDGFDVTLITDNMAGHLMAQGEVDAVIVGADRVAANGDVANKIGTYSVAVLARENGLPVYVAAPLSTVDLNTEDGYGIPIEERPATEVTDIAGHRIAPPGVRVRHPAFDVTPHRYVTAIITEKGVARPPYRRTLAELFG